jgi:hypothetical protein
LCESLGKGSMGGKLLFLIGLAVQIFYSVGYKFG